ncbi:MAG TPA: hypothetical protein PKK00_03905 [Bacteroidales bacterium]|nr:hypothetical protein [Bacteroidales bacterium]HPS16550.1 hypothetical protein [Bacteroidales bacterium]
MKNLMKLALVALVVVALNACKSSDTPDKVAEKFLSALNKGDTTEAKNLATEDSYAFIRFYGGMAQLGGGAKEVKIENMKCTEDGDKAKCDYTENGEAKQIDLLKKDGKWMVNMKKESPNLDMTEPQPEAEGDSTQAEAPKE